MVLAAPAVGKGSSADAASFALIWHFRTGEKSRVQLGGVLSYEREHF